MPSFTTPSASTLRCAQEQFDAHPGLHPFYADLPDEECHRLSVRFIQKEGILNNFDFQTGMFVLGVFIVTLPLVFLIVYLCNLVDTYDFMQRQLYYKELRRLSLHERNVQEAHLPMPAIVQEAANERATERTSLIERQEQYLSELPSYGVATQAASLPTYQQATASA
jgi:hypothetical protein